MNTNILIRAKKELVEHKFEKNVPPGTTYCYWTSAKPRRGNLNKVMFTSGNKVYAEGKIIGVDEIEGLQFEPLKEVDYTAPRIAPTRGFAYVMQ